jgi:non-heme chloroperoxidase
MMDRHRYVPAFLGCMLVSAPSLAAAQPSAGWVDPSPHSTTFVTVEDGVRLEVLDWGGRGRPLLLLAGLGDTAHVFDDFAPTLVARHRVYAVTRRGFGNSSAPEHGYDFGRLAEDVIGVVNALSLEEPIIVGHSFAGEEMHVLGDRHAAQVAALVYIDAAFNRADDSADYDAKLRELPRAPGPQPTDLVSTAALREFRARNDMPAYPEAEVRNRFVVGPEGNISGPRMPASSVREGISAAINAAVTQYDPQPIRVPALAIYAVPDRAQDLMRPWYDRNDASVQRTIEELFVLARGRYERHAAWLRSFAQASSRVSAVSGDHHLFVTDPSNVQEQIEAFAASLE